MNTIALLSRLTVAATAAFTVALALDFYAVSCFAVAASMSLLLVAAHDYANPARRWQPSPVTKRTGPAAGRPQSLRLAA